jgi:hypothetical protein
MNGHWFCNGACQDVVFKPAPVGRWDVKHGVTCPICDKDTADWVPDVPPVAKRITHAEAAELFNKMREATL